MQGVDGVPSNSVFSKWVLDAAEIRAEAMKPWDRAFAQYQILIGWEPTRWWEWRKRRHQRKIQSVYNRVYLESLEAEGVR